MLGRRKTTDHKQNTSTSFAAPSQAVSTGTPLPPPQHTAPAPLVRRDPGPVSVAGKPPYVVVISPGPFRMRDPEGWTGSIACYPPEPGKAPIPLSGWQESTGHWHAYEYNPELNYYYLSPTLTTTRAMKICWNVKNQVSYPNPNS
jgi:hypothetical protein